MHLSASFVLPPEVTAELERVVAGVRPPPVDVPAPERSRRRLMLRRAARPADEPPAEEPLPPLDPVVAAEMRIPIASFGNLTRADARRLVTHLRDAAAGWPAPRVRLESATALEWPGDLSVWAVLGGDVDALQSVAKAVPTVAQRLQLFVDRRRFRPLVAVGSITDATTAQYLEELVAALQRVEADWVQTAVSLQRATSAGLGVVVTETVDEILLDGGPAS